MRSIIESIIAEDVASLEETIDGMLRAKIVNELTGKGKFVKNIDKYHDSNDAQAGAEHEDNEDEFDKGHLTNREYKKGTKDISNNHAKFEKRIEGAYRKAKARLGEESLDEANNFDKINLSKHTKGLKAYSHGKHHEGYVDKGGGNVVHKDIHKHALASGYHHSRTFGDFAIKGGQVHTYTKNAGPYATHSLAVHTNGAGKVWNIEHGTHVDHS